MAITIIATEGEAETGRGKKSKGWMYPNHTHKKFNIALRCFYSYVAPLKVH